MSISLEQAIEHLCAAAQWEKPPYDPLGGYAFFLDGDLELHIFSPEGTTCIFWGPIGPLSKDLSEQEQQMLHMAKLVLASCREKKSVLSVHQGTFILHLPLALNDIQTENIPVFAKDFLNELTWWKQQAERVL